MKQFYFFVFLFCLSGFSNSYSQNFDAKLIEIYFANDGYASDFIKAESGFYFTVVDALHGRELWFSDGTLGNTRLVKDILPGEHSSGPQPLAVLGDLLLFNASSSLRYDHQLWVTNGTEEGTYPIENFPAHEMIVFQGKAYFSATREAEGFELWVTDGTEAGTKIFKDIRPGSDGSSLSSFYEFNNSLFFTADDGTTGIELWKSDGTPEGTSLLKDINPVHGAVYYNNNFLEYNGNFYFMADDGKNGFELYKSDGTEAGTVLVKDINPKGSSSVRLNGTVTGEGIFFSAHDGVNEYELWKSDGTEKGTVMVKNIGTEGGSLSPNNSPGVSPEKFATIDNTVYFITDGWGFENELWKTDGTEAGTEMVLNNAGSKLKHVRHLKNFGGKVLVMGAAVSHKSELWITDGTQEGTIPLDEVDINFDSRFRFEFFDFNGKVFFNADSEVYGQEMWVSDGTSSGTRLFKDFNHWWGSMPQNFVDLNGLLYFSARKTSYGGQLMLSNGSVEGTKLVKKINKEDYSSIDENSEMIGMNDRLYFSAIDGVHGYELWVSDGTGTGTQMLKDIAPGSKSSMTNSQYQRSFAAIGDILYFMANDGVSGNELWKTDGTSAGTKLVRDIYPGVTGSHPSNIVSLNNSIYFTAYDENGTGIWKTDGTSGGTVKIINISNIRKMKVVNNRLIIIADTSHTSNGAHDLWSSDGTAEGTMHVKTFGGAEISLMTILNDELYLVARNPETIMYSVYKTNGTVEGTQLIFDSISTAVNADIDIIKTCGEYVYFVVEKEMSYDGTELWRTAGSPETTIKLTETIEGVYNYFGSLACFQNDIYFIDAYNNQEIWRTDGSIENTDKINFTLNGEAPEKDLIINNLVAGKNVLYFTGSTPEHGEELYAIQNGELAALPESKAPKETIPTDMFTVNISHETCAGKDNGSLSVVSSREYSFNAMINGEVYSFNKEFHLENLSAGKYTVCITIDSNSDFRQCFEFTIAPGVSLEGAMQSTSRPDGNFVNVNIKKGTAPFVASLDGKVLGTFNSSEFTVLINRKGKLEIASDRPCEGKLAIEVQGIESIVAFPNPTSSSLNIVIADSNLRELPVLIYNISGQLISSETHLINNNMLTIDVQKLKPGIYYALLKMEIPYTVQFSKK